MTGPEMPRRDPMAILPSLWRVCDACGAVVADQIVHQQRHDAVEALINRALGLAGPVPDLATRVTALENPGGLI